MHLCLVRFVKCFLLYFFRCSCADIMTPLLYFYSHTHEFYLCRIFTLVLTKFDINSCSKITIVLGSQTIHLLKCAFNKWPSWGGGSPAVIHFYNNLLYWKGVKCWPLVASNDRKTTGGPNYAPGCTNFHYATAFNAYVYLL